MSRSTSYTLTCPCGEVFDSHVYEYVNVSTDPQLLYTVLAGLLNVSVCPACGRRSAISRPFIYSDAARNLLAYVYPRNDVPEEARLMILDKLSDVYTSVVGNTDEHSDQENGEVRDDIEGALSPVDRVQEIPPLQVVFGMDQLQSLINAVLSQQERLGRIALNTFSRDSAERGQLLHIARKLAREMQLQVEVEELSDEYTVWLFGSRRQISAIMRELAAR
ncbi:MAG TPA: CpXC domain-containing protein [Ktedonobacteraceae bacterium]|nr:CpXC domain-containing protein [Ktedonobacteraceae bacterium]